jgi:hypothetical protein
MQVEKLVLEKSAETLLEKAEECFDVAKSQQILADKQHQIAKTQRENADQQHALAVKQDSNADKLATVGYALEASAVEIKGDTLVVQRGQK